MDWDAAWLSRVITSGFVYSMENHNQQYGNKMLKSNALKQLIKKDKCPNDRSLFLVSKCLDTLHTMCYECAWNWKYKVPNK